MTGLELTHKYSTRNSVKKNQYFPARIASGLASIALRRSAKSVPPCRRWSPPASCTCSCSAAVDAILHSFKNAQVVILDNDRSLSRITTCKCALSIIVTHPVKQLASKTKVLQMSRHRFVHTRLWTIWLCYKTLGCCKIIVPTKGPSWSLWWSVKAATFCCSQRQADSRLLYGNKSILQERLDPFKCT